MRYGVALMALAATAGAEGVFVDCGGGRHPWRTTADHVLLWEGEPYLPFGGMYCARAFWQDGEAPLQRDRELLTTIRSAGIEDLYLNPVREVPPDRLQQVLDLLEELGFHYGLQVCTPPQGRVEGYEVRPDRFTTRVEQPGPVTFPAEGLSSARCVVVSAAAGEVLAAGSVAAAEGAFAVDPGEVPAGGALVKLVPRTTAAWIAPEDGERTAAYLRALRLGPGFRLLIDPIGNEYAPPRFFLPATEEWRGELADLLRERYPKTSDLVEAWGLDPTGVWTPDRAARLVPLVGGPADSSWPEVGYVVDDSTDEVFRVDLRRSRMWWDLCEAREASLRTRLNRLCDTLKAVCDVPVVAKRHHEATRMWLSDRESGGLDGLGMESYVGGDRLATFNGAATYAEVAQAKRPLWCLVTEYNGVTWTDRRIAYASRGEMYADLNRLLALGARGVFTFGLSLAGSDGDKNWTIFELVNDPRQLEWLATFARAARADRSWLSRQPRTAYAYPPQPSDAEAFTAGNLPDFGLTGSWTGERSILRLGPDQWLAPAYGPNVPGPVVTSPVVREWPCFARERQAVETAGARVLEAEVAGATSLEGRWPEFATASKPPVKIEVWEPAEGVEAVAWRDQDGRARVALRAEGEAVRVRVTAEGREPLETTLPAAELAEQTFVLSNPGFGAQGVEFACRVGPSPVPLMIVGVERGAVSVVRDQGPSS